MLTCRLLIEAARETLSERKKLQQDMQTAQKAKKNPLEEVEKAQEKFDKLSQVFFTFMISHR